MCCKVRATAFYQVQTMLFTTLQRKQTLGLLLSSVAIMLAALAQVLNLDSAYQNLVQASYRLVCVEGAAATLLKAACFLFFAYCIASYILASRLLSRVLVSSCLTIATLVSIIPMLDIYTLMLQDSNLTILTIVLLVAFILFVVGSSSTTLNKQVTLSNANRAGIVQKNCQHLLKRTCSVQLLLLFQRLNVILCLSFR